MSYTTEEIAVLDHNAAVAIEIRRRERRGKPMPKRTLKDWGKPHTDDQIRIATSVVVENRRKANAKEVRRKRIAGYTPEQVAEVNRKARERN